MGSDYNDSGFSGLSTSTKSSSLVLVVSDTLLVLEDTDVLVVSDTLKSLSNIHFNPLPKPNATVNKSDADTPALRLDHMESKGEANIFIKSGGAKAANKGPAKILKAAYELRDAIALNTPKIG